MSFELSQYFINTTEKHIISIGDLINLTSRHDLVHSFQIAKFPNLDVAPDRKKLGEPPEKLGEESMFICSTNIPHNIAPNLFGSGTSKEKVVNSLFFFTELALCMSHPFLFFILSLVPIALCHINQSQTLIFAFHECLKDLSIILLHRCL
jgi:hypothetical protein